jgi:hypothetical protein
MKTIHPSHLMLIMSILLVNLSCNEASAVIGKGSIRTEERTVDSFNTVELRSHANVEIKKGNAYKIIVSDYENLLPYITISTTDNALIISTRPNSSIINSKMKVSITMPDPLTRLEIKGSGNFYLDSSFRDLHSVEILGSGDIISDAMQQLDMLEAKIAGSGNIELRGTATSVKATIAGSGDIFFANLRAGIADCLILGSGDIEIAATEMLKARINGSGDIRYSGSPQTDIKVNGSGRIEKF